MVEIFIDGERIDADDGQTVMQAARASGHEIPYFCWHPELSVPGNCRVCMVEVENEGGAEGWLDIACNMPVAAGMRVRTDSERVRARRKEILQLLTLNHPVDCGICDKAGECKLQDYHYAYNGAASVSHESKVHASKHHLLSERIVLDNERCILCSRCVRFTHEISKSHGLGIQNRGDHSLVRAVEDGAFERDPYSDNVIDICPVGALLPRQHLHQTRVWYLEPTASICPGCERGCNVDIWHRRADWKLHRLDPAANARIDRVTPRENPAVNGPWTCNKARDLAKIFGRPRATA
ncbi:MAG: 2Fe-2S iron-sulfur cluster-binding protein, partial [Caldimonas sp.]